MNIRLSGTTPEFAGFVFETRDGRVTSRRASPLTLEAAGLSTQIVRALGGGVSGVGPVDDAERRLEVDQTNRSVIVDERWIVKHIDAWGTADRSAVIEQALATAGSRDVPGFLGSVEWEHPLLGRSTIALVSEYIPDSSDGWTWAADDVIAAGVGSVDGNGVDEGTASGDPDWPSRVGELAARVHAVLAAGGPLWVGAGSTDETAAVAVSQRVAAELVEHYAGRQDATALRMRSRLAGVLAAAKGVPAGWTPMLGVTHGDLHVGQVIRTPDRRYLLLDFDGDPQASAAEAFRLQPRELDVAHLLNSIDLVAAVAQKRLGRADASIWAWADRAAAQFLASYRAALPTALALDERALPGLRAEQLLLELRYAQRYLPVWEYAPDAVISFRYPNRTTEETPPWTPPSFSTT